MAVVLNGLDDKSVSIEILCRDNIYRSWETGKYNQ